MDIHKPKPWHGWREFLKEYLIIVIGVLTALGAEAVAETVHWRHETHVARDALAYDLKRAIGGSAATDAEIPCVVAKLSDLADILDEAGRTKRLPPMGSFPPPLSFSWSLRTWSALVAGQTLAHFPNREQTLLSGIAVQANYLYAERDASHGDWAILRNMMGPGRPVSDVELAQLNAALQRAADHQANMQNGTHILGTLVLQSGLLSRQEVQRAWDEGIKYGTASLQCKPPGSPETRRATFQRMFIFKPVRPGKGMIDTVGVGGAESTEH
jgi:hypothetical protein